MIDEQDGDIFERVCSPCGMRYRPYSLDGLDNGKKDYIWRIVSKIEECGIRRMEAVRRVCALHDVSKSYIYNAIPSDKKNLLISATKSTRNVKPIVESEEKLEIDIIGGLRAIHTFNVRRILIKTEYVNMNGETYKTVRE